ncbi:hypothetical protein ACLX1H_007957 [Fusarium chlamydosporum]
MGCHNSVMKAIGDLAVLSQFKVDSIAADYIDLDDLCERRKRVEDELENAMDATPMVSMELRGIRSNLSMSRLIDRAKLQQKSEQHCVTRIFAAAALAQLAVISAEVSNHISKALVRRAVSRVIVEIKMADQMVSPRQLSWPICVAGCLADEDQQAFFE